MDADGDNLTRLAQDETHDARPSWSPDGSKIAFVASPAPAVHAFDPFHIFVMNADGKGRRNLTGDTDLTKSWNPTWSPDGSKVAFDSRRLFGCDRIYVMTAEGKKLEQLTEEGDNTSPVYVQDGTKIAFVSHRDEDYNIYLMDTNGRNAVKLTGTPPGTENISPSWLPGAKESEMVNRQSKE